MGRTCRASDVQETPIGPVPSDWRLVRLAEISSECSSRNRNLEFGRHDVLSVDNQLGLIPSDRNLGDDFSRYKVVDNLAFAYNPMRLNVGSIGLWEARHAAIVSPDYIVFRCKQDEAAAEFLNEFRKSAAWKQQIEQSGQGSIRIRYYYRHISEFLVPLPPPAEQRAIAQVLRTVQRAKEATEKVLAATKQLKKSLLRHLFTYGPVPFDQADQVELKETEIGPMPFDWPIERFDELFSSRLGKMLSQASRTGRNPRPYLRNANVQWGRFDLTEVFEMDFDENEREEFRVRQGDVLICEGGEVGRAAVWRGELNECYFQKAIHRVRPRDARMNPCFLMYHFMHAFLVARSYGVVGTDTTIAHLPGVKLKALPVPAPKRERQNDIVSVLSSADAKIRVETSRHHALTTLFNTLLHHLMTGKVRVV